MSSMVRGYRAGAEVKKNAATERLSKTRIFERAAVRACPGYIVEGLYGMANYATLTAASTAKEPRC